MTQRFRRSAIAAGFVIAAAQPFTWAQARPDAGATAPVFGTFGFDAAGMDRSVDPGEDFYRYANGGWLETTTIPADRPNWGASAVLRDQAEQRTRTLIEQAAAAAAPAGSSAKKVGDYFAAFMDESAIERKGLTPLQPLLSAIASVRTPADLARAFGAATRDGLASPIGVSVDVDLKVNDRYAAYLEQSGLGLPDRDYYLDEQNERFAEARARYPQHIAAMLTLAGIAEAPRRAEAIVALERKIAQAHWSRVDSRQIDRLYNPIARRDLGRTYPGFEWDAFLAAAGLDGSDVLVVVQPSAVTGIAALTASEPLDVWKDYLTFHAIRRTAAVLPRAFVDEEFAMYGRLLSGTPELRERWKRGVDLVNGALGEAVGELYAARYFPPDAKAKADALVRNLIVAMDVRLGNLEWMAPQTKASARTKLASFTAKIGYPDRWRDYSRLVVAADDAFGNLLRARRFEYQRHLDKIGKAVDRGEWFMTPQTVNAYANPTMNEIVFPAGILQPPFFDPNADPAINYGAIGAVIGHEISHHFDDQGRKFDPQGKLADWWTPGDVERFKTYTDALVKQYAAYEPLPGSRINGELTLGENIADLAGVMIAYDAYQLSLVGTRAPVIAGFTGDQRFFLGYAQVWRSKLRDEYLQQLLTADSHSPASFRPYVLRNVDAWYVAFDIEPGEKMYLPPEERVRVW